jgi:hypothetical protein
VKYCGIEKDCIALLQRQTHKFAVKVLLKLWQSVCNESLLEYLAGRQKPRRPTLARHIAVRNSALKCEQLTRNVRCPRILHTLLRALEAQVIVSVTDLCSAARFDEIDLCGYAVRRAEPGGTNQGKPRVGVILDE